MMMRADVAGYQPYIMHPRMVGCDHRGIISLHMHTNIKLASPLQRKILNLRPCAILGHHHPEPCMGPDDPKASCLHLALAEYS